MATFFAAIIVYKRIVAEGGALFQEDLAIGGKMGGQEKGRDWVDALKRTTTTRLGLWR